MESREKRAAQGTFTLQGLEAKEMEVRLLLNCCLILLLSPAWNLLLPLFSVWLGRITSASILLLEGSHTFCILQTTMFHSSSFTDYEIRALLDDVETHSVDSHTGKISFSQPWANGSFTPNEWERLEMITKTYLIGFNRTVHHIILAWNIRYPVIAQSLIFCEIAPNGTTRSFYKAARNGEAFVTFSNDAAIWAAQKEDKVAIYTADVLNQDKGTITILQSLFTEFIKLVKTFLHTGKRAVERQELPITVVFGHESATGPVSQLLVCRVTGFYPRPIQVSWLQNGKPKPDSLMVNSTKILPNHDLTYQIRRSLVIPLEDTHSYSCKVEHISLQGKSLVIPWERGGHLWAGGKAVLICVTGAFIVAAAFYLWRKTHW